MNKSCLNALPLDVNLACLDVFCYAVKLEDFDPSVDRNKLFRTISYRIRKLNDTLVTNYGTEYIVSFSQLQNTEFDEGGLKFSLLTREKIQLRANNIAENALIQQLVNQDLAKAASTIAKMSNHNLEMSIDNGYVSIRECQESTRVEQIKSQYLGIYRNVKMDPQVLQTGEVIIQFNLSHALISKKDISLQWVMDNKPEWIKSIKKVRHRYLTPGKGKLSAFLHKVNHDMNGESIIPSMNTSLFDYHSNKKTVSGYLLEQIKSSSVVDVSYGSKNTCAHSASLLEPIFDFETLAEIEPQLLTRLARHLKWKMNDRIRDGWLLVKTLYLPTFSSRFVKSQPSSIRYVKIDPKTIKLQFSFESSSQEKDVLKYGAFKSMTRNQIIPVIIGCERRVAHAEYVVDEVMSVIQKINGKILPKISKMVNVKNENDLELRLSKKCPENAILLIGIDSSSDKRLIRDIAFKHGLATQFYRLDHKEATYKQSTYYNNIAAGLFSKAGGQICRIANMPGHSDMFVGLDFSGISVRAPGMSFIFANDGTQLGWQLGDSQNGEKMSDSNLFNMLRNCFDTYTERMKKTPKHITFHRDGKFYENLDVIKNFEQTYDIDIDVVEVLKSGAPVIFNVESDDVGNKIFVNPNAGDSFILSDNEMIISTYGTLEMGRLEASVRPLRIRKRHGKTDIETLSKQILYLSRIHGSSLAKHPRLPVTTHHADRFGTLRREVNIDALAKMDRLCPVYL